MNCLKKVICFLSLSAVMLSCIPEDVQAVIQKDEHSVPQEHGNSIFTNENTLAVSYNSNQILFDTDEINGNIYLENPADYVVVQYPESGFYYAVFVTEYENHVVPYEVRDGEKSMGTNQSLTRELSPAFIFTSYEYDGKQYSMYPIRYNPFDYPEFYHPTVIVLQPGTTDQELFEMLMTGDFSDCRVSGGDEKNPSANSSAGLPGSEDNPVYDEEIGALVIKKYYGIHPDWIANFTGNSTQYYDVIEWKDKTSSGFSLKNSGYPVTKVQVKIKPSATFTATYVTGNKTDILEPESKDSKLGMFDATEYEHKFQFHDLVKKYFGSYLASNADASNGSNKELSVVFEYYLRVCVNDSLSVIPDSQGWKCGKWKRVTVDGTYQDKDEASDTGEFDEDGNWVSDGDYKDDDAGDVTTSSDGSDVDSDDVVKTDKFDTGDVKSLLAQISDFPKIISKLFSFLPKWVLTLAAFSFACMIVILVIKVVRG